MKKPPAILPKGGVEEIRTESDKLMQPSVTVTETPIDHPDFLALVGALDQELAIGNGASDSFYRQFNLASQLSSAAVAYVDSKPVACGGIKKISDTTAEIKRMYVLPSYRNQKCGFAILQKLESIAHLQGFTHAILETSKRLLPAIKLYRAAGYEVTENYGQYIGVEDSVCMRKPLSDPMR